MGRCFGWALLVATGIAIGAALGPRENTRAAAPSGRELSADEQGANMADQLKDIRTQVKEINTLLHSGTLKVVVVINPGR